MIKRVRHAGIGSDAPVAEPILVTGGMFSCNGLTAARVERLKGEFGIYAVSTGRLCLAALNSKNLGDVAKAIAAITK